MYIKKSIVIVFLTFFVLLANNSFGQNPDTSNYFPHHLGDVWEYNYYDYIGPHSNILQTIIVFDSTDSIGNGYVKLDRYYIDPYQSNGYSHFFVDTCGDIYETNSFYQNNPWKRKTFENHAQPGDWWIVFNDSNYSYEIAKLKKEYVYNLFGIQTTIRNIWYYYATDTTDTTTWFHVWSEEYAQNFGLIWRGGGETFSDLFIKGCSIDGVLYGDTTFYTSIGLQNNFPVPNRMYLFQNYPNPFNNQTKIPFELTEPSYVSLTIYNLLGQEVNKLIENRYYARGKFNILWHGEDNTGKILPSGEYICILRSKDITDTKKLIMLK